MNREMVYVGGKSYIIPTTGFIAKTTCEQNDCDWKTSYAQNKQPIPRGVDLEGTIYTNLYGKYFKCKYNGIIYHLDLRNLEYVRLLGEN